jgi:hypothetical protein
MRLLAPLLLAGCATQLSLSDYVRGYAVDDEHLVVAQHANGHILRLARSDGRIAVLATGQDAWSVGVNRSHAYWVTSGATIRRAAIDGGPVEDVAQMQRLSSIAVDDSGVYWADGDHIMHANDDGTVATLATANADLDVLALDDHAVYWVDSCRGGVFRLAKAGGEPVAIAGEPTNAGACSGSGRESGPERCQYMCSTIAVDAQMAYWLDGDRIIRVAKHGGRREIIPVGVQLTSLAVDDEMIYVTTYTLGPAIWAPGEGTVLAIPKRAPGARPIVVARDQGHAQGLAVAARYVYWRSAWVHVRASNAHFRVLQSAANR